MSEIVSQIVEVEEEIRGIGRSPTIAYFYDMTENPKFNKYVLKSESDLEVNGVVYPSIHRLYLEEEDPKEYIFAKKYFGSYRVWMRIAESPMIKAYVEDMRNELKIRLQSEGIVALRKRAAEGNIEASKFLANAAWNKQDVGRPAKLEEAKADQRLESRRIHTKRLEKIK